MLPLIFVFSHPAAIAQNAPMVATAKTQTTVSTSHKTAESRKVAIDNFKQVALGTVMYISDNSNLYPRVYTPEAMFKLISPYILNKNIFTCVNPNGGKMEFNTRLSGKDIRDIDSPWDTVLWYGSKLWPDGTRLTAFTDGHVTFVKESKFEKLLHTAKIIEKKSP